MRPSRLPGVALILAAVVMITGAVIGFLAPSLRDAPPFVTDDLPEVAAAIAGNPAAWRWANGLIFVAAIITALALVPITLRFRDRSLSWAVTGLVAFALAAVFDTIDRLITIRVTTWAAPQYPEETAVALWEASKGIHLGTAFYALAFVAIGFYGIALLSSESVTWGRTIVSIAVAGVLLEVVGAGIPAYVYLATATLAIAIWKTGHSAQDPKSRPDVIVRYPSNPGAGPTNPGRGTG